MFANFTIQRFFRILREASLGDRPWEPPSEDPLNPVREPKPVIPGGRLAAVAVDEPDPETYVVAVGLHR